MSSPELPGTSPSKIPFLPFLLVWLCSFSSVAALLLHLPGLLSMKNATFFVTLPASIIIAFIAFRLSKSADRASREFLLRLKLGFYGGLIGTLGYDLVRIPFHLAGLNPLSPIQAYGMWISGFPQADLLTHFIGFLYHLGNGITFGWIYSLLLIRRSWIWAVLWALLLETLAILSPFGSVFALRSYSGAVALAYVAHLFYGIPLGLICQRQIKLPNFLARHHLGTILPVLATLSLTTWFVGDAHHWGQRPENRKNSIVLTGTGISPAWSNYPRGTTLKIHNKSDLPATVQTRRSGGSIVPTPITIPARAQFPITLDETGIHQIGIAGAPYRSVFISVHHEGDYRIIP